MKHILTVSGDMDKRMRMGAKRKTFRADSRSLCGAKVLPGMMHEVTSKDAAKHIIKHFSVLRPAWVAELCPNCVSKLEVK